MGTEPQVVGNRQARIGGCVLSDEAHLGQLGRTGGGPAAEYIDPPGRSWQQSDRDVQQGRFAGTVRTDETHDPSGWDGKRAFG
jgi:hypothetical protein